MFSSYSPSEFGAISLFMYVCMCVCMYVSLTHCTVHPIWVAVYQCWQLFSSRQPCLYHQSCLPTYLHTVMQMAANSTVFLTSINWKYLCECFDLKNLKRFLFNNQPDALIVQIYSVIKLYMFRASSLPIIRVFYCTFGIGKFHAGFDDRFQAESSWLCLETVIKTCKKLTNAKCTVENSWWWAEKMPETCRVL
jgi:hypothetical protein